LSKEERTNPIKPKVLREVLRLLLIPQFKSCSDLLTFYEPYLELLLCSSLGALVDGSEGVNLKDQKRRAYKVALDLYARGATLLRLMDGRGGFLLLVLREVKKMFGENFLNNLEIELVDIDRDVIFWHAKMFPCQKIQHLREDIIPQMLFSPNERMLLYMNFCGIADSFQNVIDYLGKLRGGDYCLISFSIARAAARIEGEFRSRLERLGLTFAKTETGRNDFVTYGVMVNNRR